MRNEKKKTKVTIIIQFYTKQKQIISMPLISCNSTIRTISTNFVTTASALREYLTDWANIHAHLPLLLRTKNKLIGKSRKIIFR